MSAVFLPVRSAAAPGRRLGSVGGTPRQSKPLAQFRLPCTCTSLQRRQERQPSSGSGQQTAHYITHSRSLCLSVRAHVHAHMSSRRPADADRPRRETANAEAKRQVQFFLTEVQPVLLNSKQKKRIKEFAQYFKEAQPLLGDGDVRLLLWGDAAVCVCVCALGANLRGCVSDRGPQTCLHFDSLHF